MNFYLTKYKNYLLPIFLALFFLTEAWSTVKVGLGSDKSFMPIVVKVLTIVLIVMTILIYRKKYTWPFLGLLIVFSLGQLALEDSFNYSVLGSFLKYLFFLLITLYFIKINNADVSKSVFPIFEIIILINSCIVLLAYIFEWKIFATYSHRFGYSGLFMASATSTYFYCIALAYFFIRYNSRAFKNPIFYSSIISVCLLGTKTALLYFVFSFALFFIVQIKEVKKRIGVAILFLMLGASGLYFFLQRGIFKDITQEKGWITSILSLRDQLLIESTIPYIQENWSFLNYIFGGLSILSMRSQMEYFDLLLFFGILGSCLYLYLLCWFSRLRDLKSNHLAFFLIILLFGGAFISGNFFYNGSIPIYFVVLILASLETLKKTSVN
ncbi:MAG: hypothetical protein ACTIKA_06540 [Psychroflexus halocasei]